MSLTAAFGVVAQSALASSTPTYSLAVVEGETTTPEYSVLNTSASVPSGREAVVSIVHDGTVVARGASENGVWLSQVPQAGDIVNLESPAGTLIQSVQYDGLPTLDPTVCAGSANFSGERTLNEEVHGGYFVATHNPYESERAGEQRAQLAAETGNTFVGNFLAPLALGQTVYAKESYTTTLAGGAVFNYSSENLRPVGGCPPPPAPPPPPPPPALSGSIYKLIVTTIRKLLRSGWSDQVIINQAGTVTQGVYLDSGKLPAYAASRKGRHHKKPQPPALLLASGSAVAAGAGTVKVQLKVTPGGRHKLKTAKRVKVVVITTLTTAGGQKLSLGSRTLLLRL